MLKELILIRKSYTKMRKSNPNQKPTKGKNSTSYHEVLRDNLHKIINQTAVRCHVIQNRGPKVLMFRAPVLEALEQHSCVLAGEQLSPAPTHSTCPQSACVQQQTQGSWWLPRSHSHSYNHRSHVQKRQDADGTRDCENKAVSESGRMLWGVHLMPLLLFL